jgi:hypothetical protein
MLSRPTKEVLPFPKTNIPYRLGTELIAELR